MQKTCMVMRWRGLLLQSLPFFEKSYNSMFSESLCDWAFLAVRSKNS